MHRLLEAGGRAAFATWTAAEDGNPVFGAFEQIVAETLGADLVPFGPFSFGEPAVIEQLAQASPFKLVSLDKHNYMAQLPDPRTLVLFDLMFLGRPGADGAMHPLFDPGNATRRLKLRLES